MKINKCDYHRERSMKEKCSKCGAYLCYECVNIGNNDMMFGGKKKLCPECNVKYVKTDFKIKSGFTLFVVVMLMSIMLIYSNIPFSLPVLLFMILIIGVVKWITNILFKQGAGGIKLALSKEREELTSQQQELRINQSQKIKITLSDGTIIFTCSQCKNEVGVDEIWCPKCPTRLENPPD